MHRCLSPDEPLLLATQDKVLIAGAVLASLAGGNELIIAHTDSTQVLEQLRDSYKVRFVLEGNGCLLPAGMRELPVEEAVVGGSLSRPVRDAGERFARLFTGGSTGRPQIWDKTAHNLVGEAAFLARRFEIGRRDIILAAVTPQHIYGLLFSVLLPLVSGASVLVEAPRFQGEIERAMKQYRATVFAGAPPHYRALRDRDLPGHCLRLAVSSGGLLPREDSLAFSSRTGIGVTEVYGSTETGGVASRGRAKGEDFWTPFSCMRWAIRHGRLCVDSPFLSPGLPRDEEGFFVTGDRACEEAEGRFDLLGRMDGIVKVAGKRVALDGVEARIKALPFIRDAYVLSLSSRGMREAEIVCLVVPEQEGCPEDLREFLGSILEPSELPRRVRRVPEIPLTPAGKRDRQRAESLLSGT
jgi:acyl-coenzyme A synthetase/AMP-(fatty) acid ligase